MKRRVFIFTLLLLVVSAMRAQVVVIAHPSVPLSTIDTKTLVEVYILTQTVWSDGSPIRVFALKSGTNTVGRFHDFLGRDALQLRKLWLRVQLTGEGRAPALVGEDEIVNRVATTPGAIGFVDAAKATDRVKILMQIGR